MITYLIPAIVSPFIGSLVDRVGKRRLWIIFCASLYIISHLLFGLLPTHKNGDVTWSSILPLTTLGIGFSLYSCVMIPSI